MSFILGIHSGHESSAVVFKEGRLVSALSEERLTRIKNDGGQLPDRAIDTALAMAGTSRRGVGELALQYTFYPEEYFTRENFIKELERKISRLRKSLAGKPRAQMLAGNLLQRLIMRGKRFNEHFQREKFLRGEGFSAAAEVAFFDHHDAHALPAAYYSGFEHAAVFTLDGTGDLNMHHTSGLFEHGAVRRVWSSDVNGTSAGLFYSYITRILGFRPLRHEGKVIGLAAWGDPKPLYEKFSRALRLSADGHTLDSDFAGQPHAESARYEYLKQVCAGHSRENISAAAQQVLEDVVLELVRRFLDETGMAHVALNGGVFANVKLNQRIAALPQVKAIFVFPAMSDTGNSVGAALMRLRDGDPKAYAAHRGALESVYWGPEYSRDEIGAALAQSGLPKHELDEAALVSTAAQAIHNGRVVGWFQGRMEFGPRALGNRSMLARPTENAINDWLNQRLDRSEFMPFAPSVLEEHADELFIGVEKARHTAAFMTVTFDVKPEWKPRIPAVVHVDGTARPQLVSRKTNPLYHKLISAYRDLSGIPLVLNTSFNVHEEPIVCAPAEAIRAFVEKRVDCLAVGPFWLEHP